MIPRIGTAGDGRSDRRISPAALLDHLAALPARLLRTRFDVRPSVLLLAVIVPCGQFFLRTRAARNWAAHS
jgi:hypothetical protein